MSITEFLLARIAEDEGLTKYQRPHDLGNARWAAECEAKRRIVALHPDRGWEKCETCPTGAVRVEYGEPMQPLDDWPCFTLRVLAAVYADHPDYDQGWTL